MFTKLSEILSVIFTPDPDFFHPGSRGQKSTGSRIRNTDVGIKLLKAIVPLVVRKSLWRPLFQPEKPKPVYVTMFSPSASVWGSLLSSFWADEAVLVT